VASADADRGTPVPQRRGFDSRLLDVVLDDLLDDVLSRPRRPAAPGGELLETVALDGDQRDLGRREEAADEDQQGDRQEVDHDVAVHLRACEAQGVPRGRRRALRGGLRACESIAGRREPAPGRRSQGARTQA
jgi:hypothetical protein